MRAGRAANSHRSGPASPFFSSVDRPVLPLSFCFCQDRGQTHYGRAGMQSGWLSDHGVCDRHLGKLDCGGAGVTHNASSELDQLLLRETITPKNP